MLIPTIETTGATPAAALLLPPGADGGRGARFAGGQPAALLALGGDADEPDEEDLDDEDEDDEDEDDEDLDDEDDEDEDDDEDLDDDEDPDDEEGEEE